MYFGCSLDQNQIDLYINDVTVIEAKTGKTISKHTPDQEKTVSIGLKNNSKIVWAARQNSLVSVGQFQSCIIHYIMMESTVLDFFDYWKTWVGTFRTGTHLYYAESEKITPKPDETSKLSLGQFATKLETHSTPHLSSQIKKLQGVNGGKMKFCFHGHAVTTDSLSDQVFCLHVNLSLH